MPAADICRSARRGTADEGFPYRGCADRQAWKDPDPRKILIVGLGGATLPTALSRLFPGAEIDAVEIDPAVVRVAQRFFGLRPSPTLRVIKEDGRVFVKRASKSQAKYDLVMLDAFDHEYIPEHLLTREFLLEVRTLLAKDGVVAANTFSSSRLYDHESATYYLVRGIGYRRCFEE